MSTLQEIDPECLSKGDNSPVETVIIPRTTDIGNFEVRRALPSRERRMVGPFVFWDQMGPGEFLTGQGVDVRPHPHIGLSTVTYLFTGSLDHKDSLGSDLRITPGDVNIMTAGSGIVHSERTGQDVRHQPSNLFGIQSWLALPLDKEETSAAFEHTKNKDLPLIEYQGMKARVVMGSLYGKAAPAVTHWDTLYVDVALEKEATFEVPVETEERAIYVVEGRISVNGTEYDPSQLLVLRSGDEAIVKAHSPVRMMVMGGAVMDGPRHIWWNFVSSSKERIEQAKRDWQEGRFEKVAGDMVEFIPLPDA